MILILFIIIPLMAGLLGLLLNRQSTLWPRMLALFAMIFNMILGIVLWFLLSDPIMNPIDGNWLHQIKWPWIPSLGIQFYFAMDGLSLLMIFLTGFLGLITIIISWNSVHTNIGFYYFNILIVLCGTTGVFLAMDLLLFYIFWELMLVPMYFLIAIWGGSHRRYASSKFFIFTQLGSLLMLLAILGLYIIHGRNTGTFTFDYQQLLGTSIGTTTALWLFLGFFAAFAVKMPVIGLHTWQADTYTEAPTAGSVILAGLLSKTGAYGFLRFAIPLFPLPAREFVSIAMILGIAGIFYGAILAYSQTDLKRLIAYSSISHLGFILIGIFTWNTLSLQGVVILMISHAISTGALFILAGMLEERLHTRNMNLMGGLWSSTPHMGGITMYFVLASMALPGMGTFIGEFLILLGTYRVNIPIAAIATGGFIVSLIYNTSLIQRVFHGPKSREQIIADLLPSEMIVLVVMIILILCLGLYPQPIINTAKTTIEKLQSITAISQKENASRMKSISEVRHATP